MLKVGSDKFEEGQMLEEIENITDKFAIITSNLRAKYLHCSQMVTESFFTDNSEETTENLVVAIQHLLEGEGKESQGSF